jgi:hypothetical protein
MILDGALRMRIWHTQAARAAVFCGLCTLALGGVVARAEDQPVTQTLDDCKLIPDDGARLACYDRVIKAGRANVSSAATTQGGALPGGAAEAGEARGGAGPGGQATEQVKTTEEMREENKANFGLPKYKSETKEEKAAEIDKLDLVVASIGLTPEQKLRVVTSSGAVWDQTLGAPARAPKPGATLTVRTNMLGGHICRFFDWPSYDCQRVQ